MALIKSDRVKETSTSTGATTFALAGAGTGYRTFSSVCAIGDTFYYAISNQSNGEWEAGLGTYSALNTLTRTAVHSSSNSGNVVTFSAGTKEVFLTLTARHLDRINDNGQSTAIGSKTSVVAVNDSATLPDLDLQFSELKTLTAKYGPTPSYSRASTGRYTNASGVLTSAAVNEPRFDHVLENGVWVSKGLLIEEQRTNICTYSEQLGHASWNFLTNITVSSNASAAPDGTNTAILIYPTASGANCEIGKAVGTVSLSPVIYTNSYYLKSSGKIWARILSIRGDFGAWFNLSNGTIGTTLSGSVATIQNVGNGWYRCTVARTTDFSTGYTFVKISDSDNSNTVTASGTDGILVWGAQVESGSFPTSYIPTVASSVTRSADVCQITGSAFTNLWNATEGSFAADWDARRNSTGQFTVYWARDSASNNTVLHTGREALSPPGVRFSVVSGSSVSAEIINAGFPEPGVQTRTAGCYKANDFAYAYNGTLIGTDNSGAVPLSPTDLLIGYDPYGSLLNGHISRLRYFRSRLDNTQLVNLSGGINTLAFKPVTGSGSVTVANEYSGINISVPNPLPITNGGTGGTTAVSAAVNLIKSAPNDGAEYTLKSKQISGAPSFYWVDSTGYAPTLDLLFAADKSLTAYTGPTPSFSRASTGTFFNSSGTLTTAAVNGPRFNHVYNGSIWVSKGLLVEEQRTNLIGYSEDLQNYATTGAITQNSTVAPDGTMTADTLTMDVGSGEYRIRAFPSTTTNVYTQSIYAKKITHRYLQLRLASAGGYANFDLEGGTTSAYNGATSVITNVGNGWYRCVCTYPSGAPASISVSMVSSMGSVYPEFITGTGTESFAIWGFQFEIGSFASSYIKSNSNSTTTRSADVCQITGGDFTSFWNASEGSFAVEYDRLANHNAGNTDRWTLIFTNGSTSYIDNFAASPGGGAFNDYSSIYRTGSQQAAAFVTSLAGGVMAKSAVGWKINDFSASFNGGAVQTDNSVDVPVGINRLNIGMQNSAYFLCGHIVRLRYYPTRLPNATLQVLST